jgi:hypothetical protein
MLITGKSKSRREFDYHKGGRIANSGAQRSGSAQKK